MLVRKPIHHSHGDTGLRRALGPVALTALRVGAIIGPGVLVAFVVAGRRVRSTPASFRFTGGGE